MKKIFLFAYCAIFLISCAFFSLGMLIPNASDAAEGDVSMPEFFVTDGASYLNENFGDEFENYFSKSFAYRSKVVDAFSMLKLSVFSEGNEQVIVGKDDFLFFKDTLGDFLGNNKMTDEEINGAVQSLSNISDYAEENGAKFLFVVAPNKNSIYPEMMPSRYIMNTEARDIDRLYDALELCGVDYLDLREVLTKAKADKTVYHKRDTHWNAEGARIALEAIAFKMGFELPIFDDFSPTEVHNFKGDLDTLLFPEREMFDYNTEYDFSGQYVFTSAYSTPMDMTISSRGSGEGKLLMFRDSFANALIPFAAASFSETKLERSVPYRVDLLSDYKADTVIILIAERNLRTLIGADERIK